MSSWRHRDRRSWSTGYTSDEYEEVICDSCADRATRGREGDVCDFCYQTCRRDESRRNRRRSSSREKRASQYSVSEVQSNKQLQLKVNFLSFQFDNQHAYESEKPDVKIIVQDETNEFVYAHKLILSRSSSVFCKMFNSKMLEEETGMVRIDDATLPVIRAVVKFCYDAEISFTDELTCEDVLEVAHKYEITYLMNVCEKNLMETLTSDNLPKRFKLAKKFDMTLLETAATKYLKKHYDTVISSVLAELC